LQEFFPGVVPAFHSPPPLHPPDPNPTQSNLLAISQNPSTIFSFPYRLSYHSWALPLSPCSPPTPLHAGTLQVASSLLLLCHPNNARAQAQRASSRVIHYVIGSHFPRPFIPGLVSEAVTTGNLTCTGSTYPLPPQQDGGR